MRDFGVRFRINDMGHFKALQALWAELVLYNEGETDSGPTELAALLPNDVKARFGELKWNFDGTLKYINNCDYVLDECVMVGDDVGELHISPRSFPYGGVWGLILLIDGFGFELLGGNQEGDYESPADLRR